MSRTFFTAALWSLGLFAVLPTAVAADAWQNAYEVKSYQDRYERIQPYRLLKPEKIEPGKAYPMVLLLHGMGNMGVDNVLQLKSGNGTDDFAKPENRRKYPCFVVVPQCPKNDLWVETNYGQRRHTMREQPTMPMKLVLELVDKLAKDLPVDKSRIYVTGISMGGFGTWDAICRRPDLFAAAMPLCGGGDVAQAAKLTRLPIWAFHGDKDDLVPLRCTVDMIEAIRQAGGAPKMTIYPGVNHYCGTRTYLNPEVLAWLFAQKRK